jgi:hypothetical protein
VGAVDPKLAMIAFDGPVWRLLPRAMLGTPAAPAAAPEGRFHHDGQVAVYASLSAEGAAVAMRRYMSDGVERVMVPLWLTADRVADVRHDRDACIVWQDVRATGAPAPTWSISDAARRAGAQAMLYASRTRPELAHVVIFEPGLLRARDARSSAAPAAD